MTLDAATLTDRIVSHAAGTGHFDQVNSHEPKNAPGNGLSCAVWFQRVEGIPAGSGLASTSALVVFNVRIQTNMLAEPQDRIDETVLAALDDLIDAYSGDFTLGGNVRAVDLLGMSGTRLSAEAGYVNQDGTLYRAVVVTLPLIVNDVWSQAP